MARRPGLFSGPRAARIANGGEIDLRKEFDLLVFGDDTHIPHGELFAVRYMRRDSNGQPIDCSCKAPDTRDAAIDCSYCGGEGHLWDEKWEFGFTSYSGTDGGLGSRRKDLWPGTIRVDYKIFYMRYNTPIRYGDKIVQMKLDSEGNPLVPYVREAIYEPQTIDPNRSDSGRIEFLAIYCKEDDALRPDEY